MSVRSFHSVFMATAVAGAALGCYLVSLRVASERAALEEVESQIVRTQGDIRLLQTEVGTRGRLAQLERWNVRALALSAPAATQILGDKFQLAKLVRPERKLDVEAPVVLASAPAPEPSQRLSEDGESEGGTARQLLHEAGYQVPQEASAQPRAAAQAPKNDEPKARPATAVAHKSPLPDKKAGEKPVKLASAAVTRTPAGAKVDPLAPLAVQRSIAKGSRADR